MAPPFETDWDSLDLDAVREFVEQAVEEGLTWEAKVEVPNGGSVRKVVAGFANEVGGTLIIGCGREGGRWTFPGVTFPGGEASTWITNVTSDLQPVPPINVRVLPTEAGRVVALVAIEPLAEPPCIADGSVFLRVSGQTVPVRDPAVLRSLFARGDAARSSAQESAAKAAQMAFEDPAMDDRIEAALAVALRPTGPPGDIAVGAFRESTVARLGEVVHSLQPIRMPMSATRIDVTRPWVCRSIADMRSGWAMRLHDDGTVAVLRAYRGAWDDYFSAQQLILIIEPAWTAAAEMLAALGCTGSASLAVYGLSPRHNANVKPQLVALHRWTTVSAPAAHEIASIDRELQREAGHGAWEPEAD